MKTRIAALTFATAALCAGPVLASIHATNPESCQQSTRSQTPTNGIGGTGGGRLATSGTPIQGIEVGIDDHTALAVAPGPTTGAGQPAQAPVVTTRSNIKKPPAALAGSGTTAGTGTTAAPSSIPAPTPTIPR